VINQGPMRARTPTPDNRVGGPEATRPRDPRDLTAFLDSEAFLRWSVRRLLLSLRVDGLRPTLQRIWAGLFGTEDRYVFVQYYTPPATPIVLPVEMNGVVVRRLTASDAQDLQIKWHEPRDVDRVAVAVVATRQGQIVGAAWYTDAVTPDQPWYQAVQPHLALPALSDANLFVVPGDKAAGWAISKIATDQVASRGVRSTVALVSTHNKRSIFLLRLLGAKIVARIRIRRWFGYTTTAVESVAADQDAAVSRKTAAH
jgi:hypothetical protein